jgi:hypothetical protein
MAAPPPAPAAAGGSVPAGSHNRIPVGDRGHSRSGRWCDARGDYDYEEGEQAGQRHVGTICFRQEDPGAELLGSAAVPQAGPCCHQMIGCVLELGAKCICLCVAFVCYKYHPAVGPFNREHMGTTRVYFPPLMYCICNGSGLD